MNLNNKRQKLAKKLTNKEYRDAWVDESVKMIVPYQIQAIRNQRDWSQELLGKKSGMLRNAISRLESVDYGNLSVNTLLRIAHGFDCGLLVKFVPFSRLVKEFDDVSPEALEVVSFEDDIIDCEQPQIEDETPISTEINPPSEYAIGVIKELTVTLSSRPELPLQLDNENGQDFADVVFAKQSDNNAVDFATA